jgi:replicative superfamily II helicase
MAFKTTKGATGSLESPEAMYNDVRPRKIKGLISHQADVLRDYLREAVDEPDVALQLPTGSGKTLVGLVLAEWRRRRFEERVVYVCPTRQLVNQVAQKANDEYGIRVHAFTGKQRDYDPAAKGEWITGQAVAVTTYNGLFNTNPFFDTPHIVIVDDAHAAENYMASTLANSSATPA